MGKRPTEFFDSTSSIHWTSRAASAFVVAFGLIAPAQAVSIRADRIHPLPPNIDPLSLGPKITLLDPNQPYFLVPPLPRVANPKLRESDTSVLTNEDIDLDVEETYDLPAATTNASWLGNLFL